MPRIKNTRNPFGTILTKKITLRGRKVTVYDARKRYRDVEGKPAQATVNRKLALLRKIFNVGVQLGWRTVNPMSGGKSLIDTRGEGSRDRF